jgi:hypothetical protein
MLTPQEALLFQAVKDEQAAQMQADAATFGGAAVGGALGATAGTVPHNLGRAINHLRGVQRTPMRALKPGWRMAGGLTGMILGGGLGAGMSAIMKQESQAAQLLGKIQGQGGELSVQDEMMLSDMLGDIYQKPSQLM